MPRAEQPLKEIGIHYDLWQTLRELEFLHQRLNDLLLAEATADASTNLKTNYAAGDLNTEAEIITAFNATNTQVNAIAASVNEILAKVRQTP